MFRKVLIPIDGSEYSLKALEIAARIIDPKKGLAIVMTVIEPGVIQVPQTYLERISMYDTSIPTGIIPKGSHDEGIERAQLIVTKAHEILTSAGIKTESKILRGRPVKSIIQLAKEEGVELIIIGSHGLGGLGKLLLGSVTSKVVEEAPCSVLVVRRGSPHDAVSTFHCSYNGLRPSFIIGGLLTPPADKYAKPILKRAGHLY